MTEQERAEIETRLQQIAQTLEERQQRIDAMQQALSRLETTR